MSRNQSIVLAVLGLAVLLIYCAMGGGLLLRRTDRFPAIIPWPTQSSEATEEAATDTPAPSLMPTPIATIAEADLRMDEWQIHLVQVSITPSVEPGKKNVHLILDVTNVGPTTSTFPGFSILLSDAEGTTYPADISERWNCQDMYGLDSAAFVDSGETARTCISYGVPLEAHSLITSPMSTVTTWSNGLAFEVP